MIKMNKKALSPVIATVLLITIVVVIGMIIFFWAKGFISETLMKNDKNVDQVCTEIVLQTETDGSALYVTNNGNIAVSRITLIKTAAGEETVDPIDGSALGAGQAREFNLGGDESEFDAIRIIPSLMAVSQDDNQKKEWKCENNPVQIK
jgi:flagellin-like protein